MITVAGSYTNATACVRAGGTVVAETRIIPGEALASYGITHTTLSPIAVNADGIEEVCIVRADARGTDQELMERITRASPRIPLGQFFVMRMARIPRNANGKIRRDLLKKSAAASFRNRS